MDWSKLASNEIVDKVAKALNERGFETKVVDNGQEAKKIVLQSIPEGAEVMQGASVTLDEIGVTKEIEESGKYHSIRKKLHSIEDPVERDALRRKAIAPDYAIGSVAAITEEGQPVAASATGSQLATYAYGAKNLILVVGTNKIVKNLEEARKRIYEHALPLESERIKKAYNFPGSSVNKILIFEKERPGRIKLILVKQKLGF